MKPKYFFFDVDGTLTDMRTGVMVPSAIDCLHRLMARSFCSIEYRKSTL